jgi:hypothetical protein
MDQQQPPYDPGTSLFQLNLDAANSQSLRSAASWARVLGVVGMIVGIMLTVLFVYMLSQPEVTDRYVSRREGFSDPFASSDRDSALVGYWMMIVTGIIFIIGGLFSYYFGNKMHGALRSNDQAGLDKAFGWLRNYFAFRSIIIIILLLFFLLAVAASV